MNVNHQQRGRAMEKNSDQLLTVFEAAARTGRKVSTWRRDILLRRIPYVKIGRSVRYCPTELAAWVALGCPVDPGAADRVKKAARG